VTRGLEWKFVCVLPSAQPKVHRWTLSYRWSLPPVPRIWVFDDTPHGRHLSELLCLRNPYHCEGRATEGNAISILLRDPHSTRPPSGPARGRHTHCFSFSVTGKDFLFKVVVIWLVHRLAFQLTTLGGSRAHHTALGGHRSMELCESRSCVLLRVSRDEYYHNLQGKTASTPL
jgi:hypothetical protein